jgi:hypothetical protein
MTRERALVINVTLLQDRGPRALLLAPVMKQKLGKEKLIFGRVAVACSTQLSVADRIKDNAFRNYQHFHTCLSTALTNDVTVTILGRSTAEHDLTSTCQPH